MRNKYALSKAIKLFHVAFRCSFFFILDIVLIWNFLSQIFGFCFSSAFMLLSFVPLLMLAFAFLSACKRLKEKFILKLFIFLSVSSVYFVVCCVLLIFFSFFSLISVRKARKTQKNTLKVSSLKNHPDREWRNEKKSQSSIEKKYVKSVLKSPYDS